MPIEDCSPLPATVSRVMASCPCHAELFWCGSWLLCSASASMVHSVCCTSTGSGAPCRLLVATAALTVHHVDPTTFTVNRGADPVVYNWSSSPSNARFWGLSRWRHDPFPGGRSARHWDVTHHVFRAATGDLFHCLTVCPFFTDLRIQWCRRCSPLTAPLFGSSTRGSSTLGLT